MLILITSTVVLLTGVQHLQEFKGLVQSQLCANPLFSVVAFNRNTNIPKKLFSAHKIGERAYKATAY